MRRIEADFRALALPANPASMGAPTTAQQAEVIRLPRDVRTPVRGARTRMNWEGSPAARTAPLLPHDEFHRSAKATRRLEEAEASQELLEGLRRRGLGDHPRVRVLEAWQQATGDQVRDLPGQEADNLLGQLAEGVDRLTLWLSRLFLAPGDQARQRQDRLQQIRSMVASGQQDRALALLRQQARAHSGDLETRAMLGGLLTDMGHYLEAEPHLEAVADQRPNRAEAWLAVGRLAYLRGQGSRAFEAFGKAWRLAPEASDTNAWLGIMAHDAGRMAEANRFLERAVGFDPGNSVARYYLGRTAMAEGDALRARFQFDLVKKLQPAADLRQSLTPEPALTAPRDPRSGWTMPRPRVAGVR
ncbi:MAG: hypothetical protein FJY99_02255 [Candidatus Sericytochromatia bacterium]|nr:hypothetical protein [Candidatus Tanganyikabacteria bacterium]